MSSEYDFEAARTEWSRVPNDIDYFRPEEWLALPDEELRERVLRMERDRYSSWRNVENKWRTLMGLDDTHGKTVLDFGCGVGVEALQFARAGNRLIVADINEASTALARRVLTSFGHDAVMRQRITGEYPFVKVRGLVDVFYSNGVLHHTPLAPRILERAAELLRPEGEVRLLLYSDVGWTIATGGSAPPAGDPMGHSQYWRFVRFFDSVGLYAEPWWREKLEAAVDGFLEVVSWDYLTSDSRYGVARLKLPGASVPCAVRPPAG